MLFRSRIDHACFRQLLPQLLRVDVAADSRDRGTQSLELAQDLGVGEVPGMENQVRVTQSRDAFVRDASGAAWEMGVRDECHDHSG